MSFGPKIPPLGQVSPSIKTAKITHTSANMTVTTRPQTNNTAPVQPPTPPAIAKIEPTKTEKPNTHLKWMSKVIALSFESPIAIALINYRFFQQTQVGNGKGQALSFRDYFRGGHIAGPTRVAGYSLALGAADLGTATSKSLFPKLSQETHYLFGGFCSAVVGGVLSVPVEGLMVKCMDAVRNKTQFNVVEALFSKPSQAALLSTWAREMPYFLGLSVGPKLTASLLPNAIPENQKHTLSLVITATAVSLFTQPADTIKTKVQQNQWTITKATTEIAKSGIKNFFVGSIARLAKVYMNFFTTWVIADSLYKTVSHKVDTRE
jgi:hypothetical protein